MSDHRMTISYLLKKVVHILPIETIGAISCVANADRFSIGDKNDIAPSFWIDSWNPNL